MTAGRGMRDCVVTRGHQPARGIVSGNDRAKTGQQRVRSGAGRVGVLDLAPAGAASRTAPRSESGVKTAPEFSRMVSTFEAWETPNNG